jgi:hypothetical protein
MAGDEIIHLYRVGAEGDPIAVFSGLVESGRYPDSRVLQKIAKIVAGAGTGPNRDTAWYELAHMAAALAQGGIVGGARFGFLLGQQTITVGAIRQAMQEMMTPAKMVSVDAVGIEIDYGTSRFAIRFSRMPVLFGLYEFLSGIDDFSFFKPLQDILDALASEALGEADVRQAASQISSHMRGYRRTHMAYARREEKFDRLCAYLNHRAETSGVWQIDDDAVLGFWKSHASGSDFRSFRTCFDGFISLMTVLETARLAISMSHAAPVGQDREDSEIDVADTQGEPVDEWVNPFMVFDEEEMQEIKFFKTSSERRPLEILMFYGPAVLSLPEGYFRHECLGAVQTAITVDLQLRRGAESVRRRLSCDEAETYTDRLAVLEKLKSHLHRLQLASLHYISGTATDGKLKSEARQVVTRLKRKGFDPEDVGAERRELFSQAAVTLVRMSDHLNRCLLQFAGMEEKLPELFEQDRREFSAIFSQLYGTE